MTLLKETYDYLKNESLSKYLLLFIQLKANKILFIFPHSPKQNKIKINSIKPRRKTNTFLFYYLY